MRALRLSSIDRKIAAVLVLLVLGVASALLVLGLAGATLYVEEVEQRLNRDLASHLLDEEPELLDQTGNEQSLQRIFHTAMVINPRLECYLLDARGRILAYDAPPEKILLDQVDLEPVGAFLAGSRLPIRGTDPRHPRESKIFTAAAIGGVGADTEAEGFLYIVLASEKYDSLAARLAGSYALRLTLWTVLGVLFTGGVAGLLAFRTVTRPLRRLAADVGRLDPSQPQTVAALARTRPTAHPDEIEQLRASAARMAERIARQVGELEQLDRLRRELVANVSHDLRTPVATLQGYLETLLLKERTLSDTDRREYLEIAMSQSERLGRLVAELFELARLDSGDLELVEESFSVSELAQDVAQKFRHRAESRGICLKIDIDPEAPFVRADLRLIERSLENLIDNALRHTEPAGTVTVAVARRPDGIQVRIADTGSGIAAEELPRIFDRFHRGPPGPHDPSAEGDPAAGTGTSGAGLGLAIVQRVLELHDSQIEVSSALGAGTVFSFALAVTES